MNATMTVEPPTPATDIAHAIVAAPVSGDHQRCLSARDSGIWASGDAGATWRHVFGTDTPGGRITATSLAFAPLVADTGTVFAGAFGTVLKSIDGGEQWRPVTLPEPAPLVTCLAVSPAYAEDGVILAGTLEDGVLRSDDRGERWRRWNFGLLDLSVYAIAASPDFARDDTLYAGTETALFTSENGGRSWRETAFPDTAAPVLAVTIDEQGTVWAGTDGHGLWRSPDEGATWTRADAGTLTEPVNSVVLVNDLMLAVLPEAILISADQGKPWHTAISGLTEDGGIAAVVTTAITPGDPAQHTNPPKIGGRGIDLLIQLRNGSVRRLRIDLGNDEGKGNQ